MQKLTLLNPRLAETRSTQVALAPQLQALRDARIAFVDNSKVNADFFLSRVKPLLEEKYGARVGKTVRKLAPKDELTEADFAELASYDAVIQCFGDCGTSTSMTVADGVRLEAARHSDRDRDQQRVLARGTAPGRGPRHGAAPDRRDSPSDAHARRSRWSPSAPKRSSRSLREALTRRADAAPPAQERELASGDRARRRARFDPGVPLRAGLDRRAAGRAADPRGGAARCSPP